MRSDSLCVDVIVGRWTSRLVVSPESSKPFVSYLKMFIKEFVFKKRKDFFVCLDIAGISSSSSEVTISHLFLS